jgi:hypothetical protein
VKHEEAWHVIPWYVNGRASAQQRASLERHMEQCPACRAEVAAQHELMLAMQTRPTVESMPHASLQKLWTRIDGEPALPVPDPARPAPRRIGVTGWLAAAVAAQAVLLGVLSMALFNARGGDADGSAYRTVSAPAPSPGPPAVRAVFAADTTLGDLQALLARAHLRIVNGPSADGVLTLAMSPPAADAQQALAILRADPAARFAEPVVR